MQHLMVKNRMGKIIFLFCVYVIAPYVLLHQSGPHFRFWRVRSDGAIFIFYLHVFPVIFLFVLFYKWFSSKKLFSSFFSSSPSSSATSHKQSET